MPMLPFSKLHGTANDFIYVDARAGFPGDPAAVARRLCDRRRGIGADGLILLLPSTGADAAMAIYNSDGSRAEMCGNGIRGLETDAGVKTLALHLKDGKVARVTVDMGTPEWEGRAIPVDADGPVIERPLEVDGRTWTVTCVSMGNPHCVVFVDDVEALPLETLGPKFEHHPFFPRRVNTEFVRVDGREHVTMRVWERGAGETMACGTGACAVGVVAARTGRTERHLSVRLPGGPLVIDWRTDDRVLMTGDAVWVFDGLVEV